MGVLLHVCTVMPRAHRRVHALGTWLEPYLWMEGDMDQRPVVPDLDWPVQVSDTWRDEDGRTAWILSFNTVKHLSLFLWPIMQLHELSKWWYFSNSDAVFLFQLTREKYLRIPATSQLLKKTGLDSIIFCLVPRFEPRVVLPLRCILSAVCISF